MIVLNETEDAYSLELKLNTTFCRSVLLMLLVFFFCVFVLIFFID